MLSTGFPPAKLGAVCMRQDSKIKSTDVSTLVKEQIQVKL